MAEQSHRDEMSAAIRAQRERQAAQRAAVVEPAEPAAVPTPAPVQRKRSLLDRLRGR